MWAAGGTVSGCDVSFGFFVSWSGADSLGSPGFGGSADIWDQVPRLFGVDPCGEEVDLYHLGGGPPVIISLRAMWSGPDRSMASWLAGGGASQALEDYDEVRDAVENGELRWVSLLWQDNNQGSPTDGGDAEDWADEYPADNVPVPTGSEIEFLADWLGLSYIPYLLLVDGNMEVLSLADEGDLYQPLDAALNYLNAQ